MTLIFNLVFFICLWGLSFYSNDSKTTYYCLIGFTLWHLLSCLSCVSRPSSYRQFLKSFYQSGHHFHWTIDILCYGFAIYLLAVNHHPALLIAWGVAAYVDIKGRFDSLKHMPEDKNPADLTQNHQQRLQGLFNENLKQTQRSKRNTEHLRRLVG